MEGTTDLKEILSWILEGNNGKGEHLTEGIAAVRAQDNAVEIYYKTREAAGRVRDIVLKHWRCHAHVVESFFDPPKLFIF